MSFGLRARRAESGLSGLEHRQFKGGQSIFALSKVALGKALAGKYAGRFDALGRESFVVDSGVPSPTQASL